MTDKQRYTTATIISLVFHLIILLSIVVFPMVKKNDAPLKVFNVITMVDASFSIDNPLVTNKIPSKEKVIKKVFEEKIKDIKDIVKKEKELIKVPEIKMDKEAIKKDDKFNSKDVVIAKEKNLPSKRQEVVVSQSVFKADVNSEGKNDGKQPSVEIKGPLAQRGIIYTKLPKYPLWAQKKGIETEIRIKFWVSVEGYVKDTQVLETSGYYKLDKLAIDTIKEWKFEQLDPRLPQIDQWGEITVFFILE